MGGIFLTGAVFAVCFGTGFFCFRLTETKREEYLKKMEAELADIAVTDLKNVPEPAAAGGAQLVTGCVAVANNYFLGVCASIRNLFGGEMHGYTRLCTDARRMALVRLKLEARALGSRCICCLRYETTVIQMEQQGNKRSSRRRRVMAYGTALLPPEGKNACPERPHSAAASPSVPAESRLRAFPPVRIPPRTPPRHVRRRGLPNPPRHGFIRNSGVSSVTSIEFRPNPAWIVQNPVQISV